MEDIKYQYCPYCYGDITTFFFKDAPKDWSKIFGAKKCPFCDKTIYPIIYPNRHTGKYETIWIKYRYGCVWFVLFILLVVCLLSIAPYLWR